MSSTEKQRVDLYSRITDRIVEDLAKGVRPWMKPWNSENTTGRITRPLRHNGQPYSGVNVLLLWSEGSAPGIYVIHVDDVQAGPRTGRCRPQGRNGCHGRLRQPVHQIRNRRNSGEVEREIPFLKAYSVFNVEQIDGLPDQYYHHPAPGPDPVERIERAGRRPCVRHRDDKAVRS
ncbi:ArdC-like ssDNA-binding domain-containing protein [Rhizobium leguminosarum]|uniref:ArdC-like ssDNA-binding domain-containing protein n=1 Tax=Rhizobium leguminosarum TaxID=384 RepID=UPI00269B5A44